MESKTFLYDKVIGERLKFYRKKRSLTQAALAAIIGISAQQLQKYEIGKNKISASRLKHLSEVLDVPIQYLLNNPRDPEKDKKYTLNENGNTDNGASKLVYYYSLIKSEKIKKLLVYSSAIYVENGM